MNLLQYITLGIIQGITEWLPISSEGITSLILIKFFNKSFSEAIPISIFLHIGTLLAAIVYFKKDIKQVIKKPKSDLSVFLIISTLISVIIAFPLLLLNLKIQISTKLASALIGSFLIVTGLIQFYTKKNIKETKNPTKKDSVILGIVQSFSIIPGLSRSGLTTSALLFRKYPVEDSLRLSFLMSIPAVFTAQVGLKLLNKLSFNINLLISLLSSFIFGLLTINLLFRIAKKINFSYFCFFLGILTLVSLFF